MQFQSPLRNLCDVLTQIKDSAKLYKNILGKNEAATRAALVDPLLRALGWDTANINMVEVEKTHHKLVRADYALYDINSTAKIIVEAKSLDANLNSLELIHSLVSYAFGFKLNDVFLTDGLVWQHYNKFRPDNFEPVKIINIATDDLVECASYFVQYLDAAKFWPVDTIDTMSQRIDQLESTIGTLQKTIADLAIDFPKQVVSPECIDNSKAALKDTDFIELHTLSDVVGKKPSMLRFSDGSIINIKSWKDVLRECCKFVLINNKLISIPFPDKAGKKILLFGLEKPVNGVSYVTEQYNGKQIFIYLNYDAMNCIKNAIHVLKLVPEVSKGTKVAVKIS